MFDTRIIRRLAYDGNYQRAIELIVDIIDGKKNYFEVKEDLEKRRKASSIITENARLKTCLQEIKKIAEAPKPFIDFLGTKTVTEVEYDYAAICNELELKLHKVLELITKAEEE